MNIFQVKCAEKGLEIDFLKENKIEQRNIVNELKLNGERNKNINLELQEEVKENYENIRKLNEKFQEIKSLKIESKSIKSKNEKEFDKLKLDGERKQMEIDKLNKKLQELESKFEIEIKSKIEKEIDKLKLEGERNKKSIGTLEKKCEQQNKEQIEISRNKFVNANQERENKEKDLMRNEIDDMRKKQAEMRTMSNRIDQTVKNVENKLLEIEINQNKMKNGEFVWRIDKINDKIRDAQNGNNPTIYSDSFYTHKHGYKMGLYVFPDGVLRGKGKYLSVYFYLMKGEFDHILQWPFKYDVTISLVNQQTRIDHLSRTKKYYYETSYNKPIYGPNFVNGFPYFIELQELPNLIRNNQIFIKCSVSISS